MSLDTWLGFLAASIAVQMAPGPGVFFVLGLALGGGARRVPALLAGFAAGDLVTLALALGGLGALLAAAPALYTALSWAGAAWCVWLGLRLWRAPAEAGPAPPPPSRRVARDAFLVAALNPKSVAFFLAFLPRFLDAEREFAPQAVLLGASWMLTGALNAAAYALLAARLAGLVRRPAARRALNRVGGAMLIGAALVTALPRGGP